jgi:hypothetical protein
LDAISREIVIGGAIRYWGCEWTCRILTEREKFGADRGIKGDWGCATDVILGVEVVTEGLGVLVRETEVNGAFLELVGEVSEVGVVEIHVLMNVSEAESGSGRIRRLRTVEQLCK